MALVLKDRVKETSTTTGTGTFTLAGAATGFQSFSVIGNGNTVYYAIVRNGYDEWEIGLGTYTSSGTTLSRNIILESSNAGAAVNFSAGTKEVFCTYPAEKAVTLDDVQTLSNKTLASPSVTGGITFADGSTVASGWSGFKNRIINGAMVIDQRNAGAAISLSNSYAYDVDRWWCQNANVGTAQQVATSNSDFPYALRLKRTAGNTGTGIVTCGQVIESVNCKDLAGQTVTLSVYLTAGANFSAASSQVYLSIITGTGTDQGALSGFGNAAWTGWANTLASAQTISTTQTKYTATVTIPAGTNEIGARIYWYPTGTAGAADYVDVTGFQLEKGSTATSFDYRPYGTELALCQRYAFKFDAANAYQRFCLGETESTTGVKGLIQFPVSVRSTSVSLTVPAASNFAVYSANVLTACNSVSLGLASTYNAEITFGVASGLTQGRAAQCIANATTNAYMLFTSEL